MRDQQNIPPLIDYSKELQVKVRTDNSSQGWTGFKGKTLWDWLQLLGVLAIPLVVAGATLLFGLQQAHLADLQHQNDIQIATDQQEQALLQSYLDRMSDLLLGNNTGKASLSLATAKSTDEVSLLAQARTYTVLQSLDGQRKGIVLEFLYESKLIGYEDESNGLHFFASILILGRASPSRTASLTGAALTGAILTDTDLAGAVLSYTRLTMADLAGTSLRRADLTGADLAGVNLAGADLFSSGLPMANLEGANLTGADLQEAVLCQTDLKGAIGVTKAQLLSEAFTLQGATLPDGSKVPGQCSS